MPQMQNRVQETTTTGGTGTLTLSGAVTGYITFASGFSTGASLFYTVDNGVGEWEIGIGTLVTTGTLSRVTVIASSNGGALVNFGSGTKRVFCSAPTRSLVPDQDSNSGKVLTTDGTNPAWTTTLNGITIGNLTAAAGAFTTLSASSTVSGTGFSTYLASPPAIGGTTAAAGAFTTLSASSTVSGTGFSNYLASPPAIGGSSPAAGNFTTLGATGNTTLGDASGDTLTINGTAVSIPNNLNFDSNTLFIDATNNRVGIGTSSPGVRLDISGQFRANPAGAAASVIAQNTGGTAAFELIDGAATPNRWWLMSGLGAATDGIFSVYDRRQSISRLAITPGGVVTIGSAISLDPTTANSLVVNSSGYIQLGTTTVRGRLHSVNAGFTPGTSAWANGASFTSSGSFGGGYAIVDGSAGYALYAIDGGGTLVIGQGATSGGLTEKVRIDSSSNFLVTGGGGLGYGIGSGGTVTQGAGSGKATAVTLNKTTGQITMNNAALAAGASVVFTLSNTFVNSTTIPVVTTDGYTNYRVECAAVNGSGQAFIRVTNVSGSNLGDAVVINFAIIKGATS